MITELKNIAPFVQQQFPAFYQEEGPNFVQFVKAYYEWLDQQGPTSYGRNLLETTDIDTTAQQFISHFINDYMHGIPLSIVSNPRLLEKHILDVYRAKGSIEGLKLLFRLLYNLDVNINLPYKDVLRSSDGQWVRNAYIEVEFRDSNFSYSQRTIKGAISGATAFVTNPAKIYTSKQIVSAFYVTNIQNGSTGSPFIVGEYLLYDGLDIRQATFIKGSPVSATVTGSSINNALSDNLVSITGRGEGLSFNVATLVNPSLLNGYITFGIVDGGFGYTNNSIVNISYLGASTGSGASFYVKQLSNVVPFRYNTNLLDPNHDNYQMNMLISASNYGANLLLANSQSVIGNALTDANLNIGTIAALGGLTSGDHNYNGSVYPYVYDSRILGYGIPDANGNFWGNNAVIFGNPTTGNGIIGSVELQSSGFGFNKQNQKVTFLNQNNTQLQSTLTLNIGAIGYEAGQWIDTSGFLNSDKYLTDSYYYQQFSYELQLEKSLDKYIDVLKQVMHPVGNKVFGQPVISDSNYLNINLAYEETAYTQPSGRTTVTVITYP